MYLNQTQSNISNAGNIKPIKKLMSIFKSNFKEQIKLKKMKILTEVHEKKTFITSLFFRLTGVMA